MRKKSRILLWILMLAMVLNLCPMSALATESSEATEYTEDHENDISLLSDNSKTSILVCSPVKVLAEGTTSLNYGEFEGGERIVINTEYQYFWVQIGESLPKTLIYSPTGYFEFEIPTLGSAASKVYPTDAFSNSENIISAIVATDDEVKTYGNLSVNAYDFRYASECFEYTLATEQLVADSPAVSNAEVISYPHAYANRVTRNEANYLAQNAINGNTNTSGHGAYPNESWGGGLYDDLEYTVYFGESVTVDKVVLYLRADYSGTTEHDTYWNSITVEFSDGTTEVIYPEKTGDAQTFTFTARETEYVKLKNLVREVSDNSQNYAALSELEVYGSRTSGNALADKKEIYGDFGREFTVHTDLYSADDIRDTITLVNDYAQENLYNSFTDNDWDQSVYHIGNIEAYKATGKLDYYLLANTHADFYNWLSWNGQDSVNGDQYCIGQLYLELNRLSPADYKIADVIRNADYNVENGAVDYHWVDAIYMSSQIYTQLSSITGDSKYSDTEYNSYLEWRAVLFDEEEGLWYRDSKYIPGGSHAESPNGNKVFWARGNAWAFAALARQLTSLDENSEAYKTYLADFCTMAESLAMWQTEDGYWNPSITDETYNGGPETSGTSGFTFGLATGIGLGILDYDTYMPVLQKAYNMLLESITAEGRLVYAQNVGESPTSYSPGNMGNSTNEFTVGLFLTAASAMARLCEDYEPVALSPVLDYQSEVDRNYIAKGEFKDYLVFPDLTVSATGYQEGNGPENLFDGTYNGGSLGVRWSVEGYPNSVDIDLGNEYCIDKIIVYVLDSRPYQYTIEVSTNGTNYSTIINAKNTEKAEYYTHIFNPTDVRYMRFTVTGCAVSTNWVSIQELLLFAATDSATNIALNKPVTCSTEESGNEASHINDGDVTTRWAGAVAKQYPEWVTIDLGQKYEISQINAQFFTDNGNRAYYFDIMSSLDGENFTPFITNSEDNTTGAFSYSLVDGTIPEETIARYIKVNVTGANDQYTNQYTRPNIYEIKIYGEVANIALNKPVTCSTQESANPASNVNDGDTTTRWAGAVAKQFPEWVTIDLGQKYEISQIDAKFFTNSGKRAFYFEIMSSLDGETFTPFITNSEDNTTGLFSYSVKDTTIPSGTVARYIKVNVTGANDQNTNKYTRPGICEIEIYGKVANIALNKPVTYSTQESANVASNVNDGDITTRWAGAVAKQYPEWVTIDLRQPYEIRQIDALFFNDVGKRAYYFDIMSSLDGENFTPFITNSEDNTTGEFSYSLEDGTIPSVTVARYIKVNVTGANDQGTNQHTRPNIYEIEVYGEGKSSALVNALIDAIGTVTAESGNIISMARTAYDSLSDDHKAEVSNYEVLTQAEERYAVLTSCNVESWNLTLGDDIGLNFMVSVKEAYVGQTYVNVTVGEGEPISYKVSDLTTEENGYYLFCTNVAAAQMTENVTIDILLSGESIQQKTYSVRDYAVTILEGNYHDRTKNLVTWMLNYGAAAQQYFGINTDNLANAGYVLAEAVLPTEYEAMAIEGGVEGIKFYGASLVFESKIAVRYYFQTDSVEGVSFTAGGTEYEAVAKNDMYYVEVPGINPQDYDKSIVLSATKGEETLTVSYSPLNYIIRMSSKGSDDLKVLINVLYGYHKSAVRYVTEKNFFGETDGCITTPNVNLNSDTGAQTGIVTVSENGLAYGYIDSFSEDSFYFETKVHVNSILSTENYPKFGLIIESGNIQENFYVDMKTALTATVVGRVTSTDGLYDWDNDTSTTVQGMAFSGEGETITLGVLKDGTDLHFFVDGNYVLTHESTFEGSAMAGFFGFNTNMTITEYFTDLTQETKDAKLALIPAV